MYAVPLTVPDSPNNLHIVPLVSQVHGLTKLELASLHVGISEIERTKAQLAGNGKHVDWARGDENDEEEAKFLKFHFILFLFTQPFYVHLEMPFLRRRAYNLHHEIFSFFQLLFNITNEREW